MTKPYQHDLEKTVRTRRVFLTGLCIVLAMVFLADASLAQTVQFKAVGAEPEAS